MFGKRTLIFFVLGIFLLGFAYYFINNFSPFDAKKVQELINQKQIDEESWNVLDSQLNGIIKDGLILDYLSQNAYLVTALFAIGLFCLLTSLHLFFDKLFFKKFYEPPSTFDAVRRSLLIVISLCLVIILKLLGADKLTIISVPVIAILIELFIVLYLRSELYRKLIKVRNKKEPNVPAQIKTEKKESL